MLDPDAVAREAQEAAGRRARRRHDRDGGDRRGRPDRDRLLRDRILVVASCGRRRRGEGRPACGRARRRREGACRDRRRLARHRACCSSTPNPAIRPRSSPGRTRSRAGRSRSREERRGGTARAQFADGQRTFRRGVVAVAIGSTTPIGVGIAHGCVARGAPSIVTRSDGPTVHPAGRPARAGRLLREARSRRCGRRRRRIRGTRDGPSTRRAGPERRRPAAVRAGPRARRRARLRDEHRAERGRRDLRSDAGHDRRERARSGRGRRLPAASGPPRPPSSSTARGGVRGSAAALAERELEALVAAFGEPAPCLAGVYTRGEIGRARGAKGDRNHSVVVAAFSALGLTDATSCCGASSRRRGGRRSSRSSTALGPRPSSVISSPRSSARRSRRRSRSCSPVRRDDARSLVGAYGLRLQRGGRASSIRASSTVTDRGAAARRGRRTCSPSERELSSSPRSAKDASRGVVGVAPALRPALRRGRGRAARGGRGEHRATRSSGSAWPRSVTGSIREAHERASGGAA